MGQKVRFQRAHTRNGHDHSFAKTPDGRICLVSNNKGVHFRIGILMRFLKNHPASNREALVGALRKVHRSYNQNDLKQPIDRMRKLGMLKLNGKGRSTTYQLTPAGQRIYAALEVEFG